MRENRKPPRTPTTATASTTTSASKLAADAAFHNRKQALVHHLHAHDAWLLEAGDLLLDQRVERFFRDKQAWRQRVAVVDHPANVGVREAVQRVDGGDGPCELLVKQVRDGCNPRHVLGTSPSTQVVAVAAVCGGGRGCVEDVDAPLKLVLEPLAEVRELVQAAALDFVRGDLFSKRPPLVRGILEQGCYPPPQRGQHCGDAPVQVVAQAGYQSVGAQAAIQSRHAAVGRFEKK